MDGAIKIVLIIGISAFGYLLYVLCFTKFGNEWGWNYSQRDPFQRRVFNSQREYTSFMRVVGYFGIPMILLILLALIFRFFVPA
jgi:hypothetical protein